MWKVVWMASDLKPPLRKGNDINKNRDVFMTLAHFSPPSRHRWEYSPRQLIFPHLPLTTNK